VRDGVGRPIRMVAVGMLKEQKNYFYLIEAFRKLDGADIRLDIYGEGPLRAKLQAAIDRYDLPITLKGKRGDIYNVLPEYDLYVMSSAYEGFGIAPVEAMAVGLPALLSDLPVLREVSGGNALFFDPANPADLVAILERIMAGEVDLKRLSAGGISLAESRYQRSAYVEKLGNLYSELIGR
jgi:glycosyltransferase involved in cell wall biosynthesis